MTLYEFHEAKKQQKSGSFIIEGTVSKYGQGWSSVIFQSQEGEALSTLKITSREDMGYVSWYPHQLKEINLGDSVRVTGSFRTVPYYSGMPNKRNQKMTTATLASIKVLRPVGVPVKEE